MKENLLTGNLLKLTMKYGGPSILTMWIFSLYTIVDGIFIGKFLGSKSLAAVNIVMPYINFSFALGIMVAIGSSTMISIQLGANNYNLAKKIYSLSIQLFVILGGLLSLGGIFFSKYIVIFLGANDLLLKDSSEYLFYLSFFTLFYLLSYGLECFVRIEGKQNYSLICILGGALMNILLDYILIVKLNMGIKGAGIATGVAQLTTSVMLFLVLYYKGEKLKYKYTKLKRSIVINILYNGSSEFLTEITTGIVLLAFNIYIMKFIGNEGVSAFSIIGYISTLVTMTMIGFSQGIQPIISFNYGAKNYKRVFNILKLSLFIILGLGILFYSLVNIFSHNLVLIFAEENENLYRITKEAIKYYSITYLLMGINILISSYFTAIENAFMSCILSILRGLIFINLLLYVLPKIFLTKGIWMSSSINEFITILFSIYLFNRSLYKEKNI